MSEMKTSERGAWSLVCEASAVNYFCFWRFLAYSLNIASLKIVIQGEEEQISGYDIQSFFVYFGAGTEVCP